MPCYHPLTAYRVKTGRDPKTGRWPITFRMEDGYHDLLVTVPCGQCIGCRLERSRQWAIRCVHEASLHATNCFVTLTYSDENLKGKTSLNKEDMPLFLKRLRKRFGAGIRFFQCGEYGELMQRPHHHAIIFNHQFPDIEPWTRKRKVPLYRSQELERLWPFGFCTIGEVTFESAAYVARYITKKITGEKAEEHYGKRIPEYITMSRRPGIAHDWIEKYRSDVYPADQCVVRADLVARPPKYYDSIYDVFNPEELARIKKQRVAKAKEKAENNTYERLEVREKVQVLKAQKLIRSYETREENL